MCVITVLQDYNKYGFDLIYRMEYLDTAREVARGKIGIVFIDRDSRKVVLMPTELVRRVTSLVEGGSLSSPPSKSQAVWAG